MLGETLEARNFAARLPLGPFNPLVPTVFHEDWWLDTATRGQIKFVEVCDSGRMVGRLPYMVTSRYGLSGSNMPTLTHFLGAGIDEGNGSNANRYVKRQAIERELIRKLPALSSFRQKMHRGVPDALSFQAEGYQACVQFTFEIPPVPEDAIWKTMRDKTRNVIRRASETYNVCNMADVDAFFHLILANLQARNEQANVDFERCKAIAAQALEFGRGEIWVAQDANGAPKAAILCVWDRHTYYYLMSTRAPDSGNGIVPLLLWNAIKSASFLNLTFDFDGVASEGSILLFSGFGGKTSPRYIATRSSTPYKILRQFRRVNAALVNNFG
jgi:hypothetical protein